MIFVLVLVVGGACQGPAEPVLDGGEDAATTGDGDGEKPDADADAGAGGDDAGTGGDDAGTGGDDAGGGDEGGDEGPIETCGDTTFTYDAGATQVTSVLVSGTFNGWAATVGEGAWEMTDPDSDNVWSVTQLVDSGRHLYKLIVDGDWIADPSNPDQEDDGLGGFNSVLTVDCDAGLEIVRYSVDPVVGTISALLRLVPAELVLDAGSVSVTLDHLSRPYTTAGNEITISLFGVAPGIHDLRVSAASTDGKQAGPVLLKFHFGVSADWRDTVLYFAMTDRFYNGNQQNDDPVAGVDAATNYQGGDFEGIRQKIASGNFDDLGVSAIWISWPVDNLDSYEDGGRASQHECNLDPATMQTTPTRYTAYHGYWPVQLDQTESRFGTLTELQAMVDTAHAHGIRILLDFTANHVHTDSPFYQTYKNQYFNWPDEGHLHICQDVGWDTEPETCWFTSYLADLDYRKPEAVEAMVDMGVDWIVKSGADGFRVDAVKHINRAFLSRLRERLATEVELTSVIFYLVGETFTGDAALIASFIGPDLIHGQFDFPANWQVLKAFATGEIGLDAMDSAVRSAKATYGSSAIMSNFIGNHDIARFLSLASSDIFCGVWDVVSNIAQGWLFPPGQPIATAGYQRLRLAFTYIMTIPGVPLIYYGDEFGIPGAGDPDNRRMMRFGADLNANESSTLTFMQKLGQARADHPALRTGTWPAALQSEADILAYPRVHTDETAIIVLNRGGTQQVLSLDVSGLNISDGTTFTDVLEDAPSPLTVAGGLLSFTIPAGTAAILVSQ
jgi:glycosidase